MHLNDGPELPPELAGELQPEEKDGEWHSMGGMFIGSVIPKSVELRGDSSR